MAAITRGQASDCTSPVLDIFTQTGGVLVDVAVLEFQIFDVSSPLKKASPAQVYPETSGARGQ